MAVVLWNSCCILIFHYLLKNRRCRWFPTLFSGTTNLEDDFESPWSPEYTSPFSMSVNIICIHIHKFGLQKSLCVCLNFGPVVLDVWRLGLQDQILNNTSFRNYYKKLLVREKEKWSCQWSLLRTCIYYKYSVELLATLTHFMWTGTPWPAGRWDEA